LIDLYARLARSGVTVPGGSCPSVGVAGVTLGGGFGLAARHLGLTIDSLRGGTEFTFATHPLPASSTFFKVAWPWSSAGAAIEAWHTPPASTSDRQPTFRGWWCR
jgi:hypothetical protein